MDETSPEQIRQVVADIYCSESRRVFATLIRLLGDFDLAEEALHEAFAAAVEQWSREGVPANPRAWLVSTGRFRAIDAMRRRTRFDSSLAELAHRLDEIADANAAKDEELEDDRLRLIFTCCHPALTPSTQVALTLREVCGLTTEEIASAFLTTPPTIAQRIVRGKAKIRAASIPYQVPPITELPERLDSLLAVIYLVFNEGYSASAGHSLTRPDLSEEAIRLGRLLVELLPDPEAMGLLALMLLQESRRAARTSPEGDLILLENQDRSLWDREKITEALAALVERAIASLRFGVYSDSSGHRCRACHGADRRGNRLGSDCGLVRRARADRAVTHRRVEPGHRGGHARRPVGRAGTHRRDPGPWRIGRLPPGPRRARRPVPEAGADSRRPGVLPQRAPGNTGARQEPQRRFLQTGGFKSCHPMKKHNPGTPVRCRFLASSNDQ